jgi:hypothetical protein
MIIILKCEWIDLLNPNSPFIEIDITFEDGVVPYFELPMVFKIQNEKSPLYDDRQIE